MPSGILLPQQNLLSAAVNFSKNPFITTPSIIAQAAATNGIKKSNFFFLFFFYILTVHRLHNIQQKFSSEQQQW